ncbi:hypothetical protein [Chryseobacterium sp. KBW03]|uniref:hypothetical protein n=1 Tax=Chryseobacterium sp. KBW03 TaxID=2153362 RepID=UPI000F5A4C2C|nr:hypothetical protein [Chryseobacterium sp. KBW03]
MDRNYFLSCGHKIAILLLMAAVGKLNAKFISVAMGKSELPYRTDINSYLQQCLASASVHQWPAEGKNLVEVNERSVDQKQSNRFYSIPSQYNFLSFNDSHIQIVFLRDIKFVAGWNKWGHSYSINKEYALPAFKEAKEFYTNSFKLIEGFKFLIKIPDKSAHTLVS